MKKVIFAALLLGASIAPAHAETSQTAQMIKSIDAFVTAHAGELVDDTLTAEQVVQMKLIAHQAAVAASCDGFKLSEEKFVAAFSKLAHMQEAGMNDAEKTYFVRHLLVTYGVLLGGALAVAAPCRVNCNAAAAEARLSAAGTSPPLSSAARK